MKIGFGHVPTESLQRHVELIRWASDAGFDTAWVADQTLFRDPYALLTLAAAQTNDIGLGLAVTNPFTRHPAMAARSAAAITEVSGGRMILGFGAGNRRELIDPLHLDGSATARRIKESVEIVKLLHSGDRVDYVGRHYSVDGIGLDFQPAAATPVYVAGRGPRVLEVAGEVADGAIIGALCSPGGVAYARACIERGARRAGRADEDIPLVSWVTCVVTPDADADRAAARPMIAHVMGGAPAELFEHLEIPSAVVERIRSEYREGGKERAAEYVTSACLDAFTIIGDANHCLEAMQRLEGAGIGELAVLLSQSDVTGYRRVLEGVLDSLRLERR